MSYSVPTWTGAATPLNEERGWMMQRWKAIVDNTTQEPSPDATDWALQTPVNLTGISFLHLPDNRDFLQTRMTGLTLLKEHVNRPPEVYLSGITLFKHRNKPYLKMYIE